jgi:hypothetical protein
MKALVLAAALAALAHEPVLPKSVRRETSR